MKNTYDPDVRRYARRFYAVFPQMASLLFLLFFTHSPTLHAYGSVQVTITSVSTSFCPTGAANCYQFTISNVPPNLNPAGNPNGYSLLWHFGDGDYLLDSIPAGNTTKSVYHEFRVGSLHQPSVQLAARYTDDKKPKKFTVPSGGIPSGYSTRSGGITLPDLTQPIVLTPSLMPRAEDTSTYVLSFQVPGACKSFDGTISVNLNYHNSGKVRVVGNPIAYDEKGNFQSSFVTVDGTNGTLSFTLSNPFFNQKTVHFFVDFRFTNLATGDPVTFSATMQRTQQGGSQDCLNSSFNGSRTYNTVRSHDPNVMIPHVSSVCPDGPNLPTSMTYTIVFQNIGNGDAESVIVRNIVPHYFKLTAPSDISTIEPAGLNVGPLFNTTTRQIEWVLTKDNGFLKDGYSSQMLKGTGQAGYEKGSPNEHFTTDSIVFKMAFDPAVPLPPCGVIVNRAEIFFDSNQPITTEDCYVQIKCKDCKGCDSLGTVLTANPVFLQPGKPVNILSSFDKSDPNATCTVYPPVPVSKSGDGSPVTAITEPGIYTVVCVSNCGRTVTEVPVVDPKNTPAVCVDCNWWRCTARISTVPPLPADHFVWYYQKDGAVLSHNGEVFPYSGADSVQVVVTLPNGSRVSYKPCLCCWKISLIRHWWAWLVGILLLLWLLQKARRSKR